MKKSSAFETTIAIISILIGVVTLYFTFRSSQHEKGGSLEARYNNTVVDNDISRTIFVCMDSSDALTEDIILTPVFNNVSEYSIKDFSLEYVVESSGVSFTPTDFYRKFEYGHNKNVYRYEYNVLSPYSESERPFMKVNLQQNGAHCLVTAKATYDGAPQPFRFMTDIRFIVVDNRASLPFEDWKLSCKKKMYSYVDDQHLDVCYCFQGNVFSEMNIVVNDLDSKPVRKNLPEGNIATGNSSKGSVSREIVSKEKVKVSGAPLLSAENFLRGKVHYLRLNYTSSLDDRKIHLMILRQPKTEPLIRTILLPAGTETAELQLSATHESDVTAVKAAQEMEGSGMVLETVYQDHLFLRDFSHQRKLVELAVVKDGKTSEYVFELPFKENLFLRPDVVDVQNDSYTCTYYRVPGKSGKDLWKVIRFWFVIIIAILSIFIGLIPYFGGFSKEEKKEGMIQTLFTIGFGLFFLISAFLFI